MARTRTRVWVTCETRREVFVRASGSGEEEELPALRLFEFDGEQVRIEPSNCRRPLSPFFPLKRKCLALQFVEIDPLTQPDVHGAAALRNVNDTQHLPEAGSATFRAFGECKRDGVRGFCLVCVATDDTAPLCSPCRPFPISGALPCAHHLPQACSQPRSGRWYRSRQQGRQARRRTCQESGRDSPSRWGGQRALIEYVICMRIRKRRGLPRREYIVRH